MSEYHYYEFLAVDRPLTAGEQAEVHQLSTRARITATSFTNEYHWGNFRGDPLVMMRRYYDAHLYLANWGTHQIMLRLPRTLLSPKIAEQYSVDGLVGVTASPESVILDLTSEDSGEWVEGAEESLSAIVGVRSELAAGDLRGCIWRGCRPTAGGNATRTRSATRMRMRWSRRCRPGWGR